MKHILKIYPGKRVKRLIQKGFSRSGLCLRVSLTAFKDSGKLCESATFSRVFNCNTKNAIFPSKMCRSSPQRSQLWFAEFEWSKKSFRLKRTIKQIWKKCSSAFLNKWAEETWIRWSKKGNKRTRKKFGPEIEMISAPFLD